MIRWKVVTEERESWSAYSKKNWLRGYNLKYKVGTIVKAIPGSLGIMTFKCEKDAEKFLAKTHVSCFGRIIKVETKGRGKVPAFVYDLRLSLIDQYMYKPSTGWSTPPGTICYNEVKVLT